MKVIGAGFGRTGTLSIKTALEKLGFGPCYHMSELGKNAMHVEAWKARAQGVPVDWKKLFEGYRATVDWPACTYYEELMETYPDAKVLLNIRDPERWYDSVCNTIFQMYKIKRYFMTEAAANVSKELPPQPFVPGAQHPATLVRKSRIWDGTFAGKFEDREHAIKVFKRHNEEVKKRVPADRLLVYEVKDGWEPLCEFLNIELPKGEPFPRLNESDGFWDQLWPKQAREMFEEHQRSHATNTGELIALPATSSL